jgi:hypothetical protein
MKETPFRSWLRIIWTANAEERADFGFSPITLQEYFNRYKYWLKREYRYQQELVNNNDD